MKLEPKSVTLIDNMFHQSKKQWKNYLRSGSGLGKALTVPLANVSKKDFIRAIVNGIKLRMFLDKQKKDA